MKENKKLTAGITLISLVVTIIVLLILAGVTLTMLTGENGIMTRAKTAREQHVAGQELEENRLSGMENVMGQYLGNTAYDPTAGETGSGGTTPNPQIVTYIVRFNSNGGTGTMEDQEFIVGTPENLSSNSFTRSGYEFNGWNTKADGSGTSYGNSVEINNENSLSNENGAIVNLYAIWKVAMNFATRGDKNSNGKVDTWDEVAFGDEEFYVIKKEGTTLTLLAKHNLATTKDETTGKWKQLTAAGGSCAFSADRYWDIQKHWTKGTKTDLNNYETTYNETMPATETEENNAIKRARAYAGYFEATGRLLSWGEVTSGQTDYLFTNNTGVLSNCDFWLGSSCDIYGSSVQRVWSGDVRYSAGYYEGGSYGVRPVLIVSDSLSR